MKTKIQLRAEWIKENESQLRAAMIPDTGSNHNAKNNPSYSGGGWGYWVQAFRKVGLIGIVEPMKFWSGFLPTPSTAINLGVARYIQANAPKEIL